MPRKKKETLDPDGEGCYPIHVMMFALIDGVEYRQCMDCDHREEWK